MFKVAKLSSNWPLFLIFSKLCSIKFLSFSAAKDLFAASCPDFAESKSSMPFVTSSKLAFAVLTTTLDTSSVVAISSEVVPSKSSVCLLIPAVTSLTPPSANLVDFNE